MEIYFAQCWRLGSLRSRYWQTHYLVKTHLLVYRTSSHYALPQREGQGSFLGPVSYLRTKGALPNAVTVKAEISALALVRMQTQHSTQPLGFFSKMLTWPSGLQSLLVVRGKSEMCQK